MIFIEKAPSYAFVEYINKPYTAVVLLRLLQGSSLKESEIIEAQEGNMNYSVKILLLGKYLFCCDKSYCLFIWLHL